MHSTDFHVCDGTEWFWVIENERRVPLRLQIGLALAAQDYLWRRAHLLRAESMLAACVAQSRNYVASGGLLVVNLYVFTMARHVSSSRSAITV